MLPTSSLGIYRINELMTKITPKGEFTKSHIFAYVGGRGGGGGAPVLFLNGRMFSINYMTYVYRFVLEMKFPKVRAASIVKQTSYLIGL